MVFQLYFSSKDTEQRQVQSPPVNSTHHIFYSTGKVLQTPQFSMNSSSLLAVSSLIENDQLMIMKLRLIQTSGPSDVFGFQFENQTKIQTTSFTLR